MSAEIDGPSKGLLGAFAALTFGSGIATLGYGVYLLHGYHNVEYNYGDFNLFMTSTILIGVGSLLLITLLLGVFGALKDISNLRWVTLVLLFLLFVILAIIGVYAIVSSKTGRLQKSINDEIENLNSQNNNDLSGELKKKAEYLTARYNCCAAYVNYDSSKTYTGSLTNCCLLEGCIPNVNGKTYVEKGCAAVYFETKTKTVFYVGSLALIAAGVVLVALILYGGLSQRARAGYAVVSRGQLK